MTLLLLFSGVIAGAILGIIADWLLKPILPENPRLQHSIAGVAAVLVLSIFVVFVSRLESDDNKKNENILTNIDALATVQSKSNEDLQSIVATIDANNINATNPNEIIGPTLTAVAKEHSQLVATNEALENLPLTSNPTVVSITLSVIPTPELTPTPVSQSSEEYLTGLRYENGYNVEQNWEEAIYWFRRAANKGLVEAMEKLASMYEAGVGVPIDLLEAERWRANAEANNAKRFTVPCEVCGNDEQGTFHVYILEHPANPNNPLEEEVQRLWEDHQVTISEEIVDAFAQLYSIAEEHDVSFIELVILSLGKPEDS